MKVFLPIMAWCRDWGGSGSLMAGCLTRQDLDLVHNAITYYCSSVLWYTDD